jgi:hypothetical protein
MDGSAVKACRLLAAQADGAEITTIEGLATNGHLHPMQEGFWERHGLQCGYCTPGMVMSGVQLLARNASPTRAEIADAIRGNLCRCTGYSHIIDARFEALNSRGVLQRCIPGCEELTEEGSGAYRVRLKLGIAGLTGEYVGSSSGGRRDWRRSGCSRHHGKGLARNVNGRATPGGRSPEVDLAYRACQRC